MEIRFAKKTDMNDLKNIWKVCFGDTAEYVNFFFDNMFKPQNAVVAESDGRAVGVIHTLDAHLSATPFKYGYAIGVLPCARGNSVCKKMHDYLKGYCEENGYIYGLHPANDKLSLFYKSIGLSDMYSLKTVEIENTDKNADVSFFDITPSEYLAMREKSFLNMVSWDINTISYMFDEAKHFGGCTKKLVINGNERLILAKENEDSLIVKETTLNDDEILLAHNAVKNFFGKKKVVYKLPCKSSLSGLSKTTIYGFGEKNDDVYMNLYFD